MNFTDYQILEFEKLAEITEAIKEAMLEGWQPLGGAYCYWDSLIESSWYGQAMVK
jgi:hypothetical protein